MIRYQYATDSVGKLISAESLVGIESRDTYSCLGCERELVARVNGSIQRPHFGHKAVGECNGETYLHRLGKKAFVETFQRCQQENTAFTIRFEAPRVCNRFKSLTNRTCDVGSDLHEYDLTQYYTDMRVEKRDGKFIPDVSLHSKNQPEKILYIEIAVNHFLSPEKSNSGKRIIEIPVSTEDDIEMIRSGVIDDQHASFKGFSPEINVIPNAECNCAKHDYFAFYIFKSGKALLDHGSLRSLESKINGFGPSLAWLKLMKDWAMLDDLGPNKLFVKNVHLANKDNVSFKNCHLCKHHGRNWSKSAEHGIFCKTIRKACNSNDANTCDRYRLSESRTKE